jgi:DNA-binding NarL/FixJ family response regulator
MTTEAYQVLLIEDNPLDAAQISGLLADSKFKVQHELTLADGLWAYQKFGQDVILLGGTLPEVLNLETLAIIRDTCPAVPIVMLTGGGSWDVVAETIAVGTQGTLVKGQFDAAMLKESLRGAIRACPPMLGDNLQNRLVTELNLQVQSWKIRGQQLRGQIRRVRDKKPAAIGVTLTAIPTESASHRSPQSRLSHESCWPNPSLPTSPLKHWAPRADGKIAGGCSDEADQAHHQLMP